MITIKLSLTKITIKTENNFWLMKDVYYSYERFMPK